MADEQIARVVHAGEIGGFREGVRYPLSTTAFLHALLSYLALKLK